VHGAAADHPVLDDPRRGLAALAVADRGDQGMQLGERRRRVPGQPVAGGCRVIDRPDRQRVARRLVEHRLHQVAWQLRERIERRQAYRVGAARIQRHAGHRIQDRRSRLMCHPASEHADRGDGHAGVVVGEHGKCEVGRTRVLAALERIQRRGARGRGRVRADDPVEGRNRTGAGDPQPRHRRLTAAGIVAEQRCREWFEVRTARGTNQAASVRGFLPNSQARPMLKM
jgi:hypothetical protein